MSIVDQIKGAAILGLAKNPFTIVGTMGAGNVLTVTPLDGYTATPSTTYQWTSNGADIAGQTSNTYTQLTSDRNKTIGCRVAGLAYFVGAGVVPLAVPGAPTGISASAGNAQITGTATAPADNGGSAITGYQMPVYRASDNVLLGTATGASPTLTLTGIANGVAVYCKMAAVNAVGVGPLSAASSTVTPTATIRTGQLRAVSAFNRHPSKAQAGSTTYGSRVAMVQEHIIGSGDVDGIVARLVNFFGAVSGTTNISNTVSIQELYLEHEGLNMTKPMAFGGNQGVTLTAGQQEQLSDVILPSAFGLTKFSRGDRLRFRAIFNVPQSGAWPTVSYYDSFSSTGATGSVAKAYDPSVTTCTNIAGTGALTFTGTAPSIINILPIVMLGTFVSGDPLVVLGAKDSLGEGFYDASATFGAGQFNRALVGDGSAPIAGFNASVFGTTYQLWTNGGLMYALLKYVNFVDYGLGTNSFTYSTNTPATLTTILNADKTVWTAMRNNAVSGTGLRTLKISGEMLGPRTASGGDYTTLSGQTILSAVWNNGGDVATRNATYLTYVGAQLDYTYDPGPVLRGGTDPSQDPFYKWAPNLSQDGTHYNSAGAAAWATSKRAFYLSVF